MRVFSTDHHLLHKPSFELKKGVPGPPYDDGSRVARIRDALKTLGCAWEAPADFGEAPIRAVHDDDYVDFLKTIWGDWEAEGESNDLLPLMWPVEGLRTDVAPQTVDGRMIKYAFDSGTAITAGTWAASYAAAQCAIAAAEAAQRDGLAYALTRPPGHHAMRGHYGGYCFLNGAAIAA
ncbi:MAG: histone deacetylase family protein, partial [Pseudomonadota bacterium]